MEYGTLIPALVTPYTQSGDVAADQAAKLAAHLVKEGCDGIVVAGSTAESPTLSDEEKLRLLEAVLAAVGDHAFVWMGTGSNSTRQTVVLTREAQAHGAHGIMLVTPYYNKPQQEGLYQHFRTVAEATDLPVMLYNVPGRTAVNLLPETVARLAQDVPNIVAIKEASGSLEQMAQVLALAPQGFILYSGDDALTLPALSLGGRGVVSVAAHVIAGPMRALLDAFQAGALERAQALHLQLLPLFKALFVTTNPVPVKAALEMLDWPMGGYRLPLVGPTDREEAQIRKELERLGLLK